MRIEWATFCDGVNSSGDGYNILGALVDTSNVPLGLTQIEVVVAAVCAFGPADLRARLKCEVFYPDMTSVGEHSRGFTLQKRHPQDYPPGYEGRGLLALRIVLPAEPLGTYTFRLSLHGSDDVWTMVHHLRAAV